MIIVDDRGSTGTDVGSPRALLLPVALLALLMVASLWVPAFATAEEPATSHAALHQIFMMQGDNPDTEEVEPRDLVVITDRSFWSIPAEVDTIYTFIPATAEHVLCDNVVPVPYQNQTLFMPGRFSASVNPDDPPTSGVLDSGEAHGMAYWSFPAEADRSEVTSLVFSSDEDWQDFDPDLTDGGELNISSGGLSLAMNVTEAVYTSKMYTGGIGIVSVNMSVVGEEKGNMSFEVTWDNGTTWQPIDEAEPLQADGSGNGFRWRVTMNRSLPMDATPVLDGVTFDVTFVPEQTELWLETTYHVPIPSDGPLEMRLVFPFDDASSGLILLAYFDDDMVLDVNGTAVTKEVDGTYPGKTTYFHMQGAHDESVTLTITDTSEEDDSSWGPLLALAIVMVLVLVVLAIYAMRGGPETTPVPSEEHGSEPDDDTGEGANGSPVMEELERTKANILEEISELDRMYDEGQIDDEEHEERRAELKARAVDVMKQMEALDL